MDNKVIDVLKTFDVKELRRFGEFIESPYFNKNENVRNLFKVFSKYHPSYENRNFTIEKVYEKVFKTEKFDYHKIHNVISDLYKLTEKFIAQSEFERNEYYIERNIFRALREKKLYKIYEQKHTAYVQDLINRNLKDEHYYFYLYELNDEYLWYATIRKPNTELNILQTEFDYFFNYALIRLLRFYNLMLHEQNQNNVNYEMTMLDEIMNFIREKEFKSSAVNIFKTILMLLKTKEVEYYKELWSLKEKHFNEFHYDDQQLIYIHLYDFAAYMVNFKSDDSYNMDMFNIYKEMMENGFMTKESFLYPNFMNVIKIACRVKEFHFAEKTIEVFKDHLPVNEREDVLQFCYGTIENAKGNYEKALMHFSKSNFQNFIFKVQIKILLLKLNYKLERYDETFGIIDSFRHYIAKEENLLAEHREAYNIFLRLMSELIRVNELNDKEEKKFRLQKIKKEAGLMPANPFRIKVWLLDELK